MQKKAGPVSIPIVLYYSSLGVLPHSSPPCWPTSPAERGPTGTAPERSCKWPGPGAHSAQRTRSTEEEQKEDEPKVERSTGRTKKKQGRWAAHLSVGRCFQEAEAVPEAFAGQTELNLLLLQEGGRALQNNLVVLQTAHKQNGIL